MIYPDPVEWRPTLFVTTHGFFWVWIRSRSWRGPFAQWEER